MRKVSTGSVTAMALAAAGLALSGCAESRLRLSDDFSRAVRQDVAAQIADPDAAYRGLPTPGSSGRRAGLAQSRYERNAVIRPVSTSTSSATAGGGDSGGSGSGGAGAAAGP